MIALDASALLALLFEETGHAQVAQVLDDCCMSTVNLAEVLGRFARDGHETDRVSARLQSLPIEIVPFGVSDAVTAASLLPATRPFGLSLGDRACLALARSRGIAAMTADTAWTQLALGIEITVIR